MSNSSIKVARPGAVVGGSFQQDISAGSSIPFIYRQGSALVGESISGQPAGGIVKSGGDSTFVRAPSGADAGTGGSDTSKTTLKTLAPTPPVVAPLSILNSTDWGTTETHTWNGANTEISFPFGVSNTHLDHTVYNGDLGYEEAATYVIDIITANEGGGAELEIIAYTTLGYTSSASYIYADGSGTDIGGGLFKHTVTIDMSGLLGQINRLKLHQNMSLFPITIQAITNIVDIPLIK